MASGCSWKQGPPSLPLLALALGPLLHPDFPKLPSSKFLLHLEGLPGDLPGRLSPKVSGAWRTCRALSASGRVRRLPSGTEPPGQPRAGSPKPASGFSPSGLPSQSHCLAPVPRATPSKTFPREQSMVRWHLCPPVQQTKDFRRIQSNCLSGGEVRKTLAGLKAAVPID